MREKTIFINSILKEEADKFKKDNKRDPTPDEASKFKDNARVVLKKMTFGEQCKLKGKITKISITAQGREKVEVDSEAFFFYQAVLGVKSLPDHPEFNSYSLEKKEQTIRDLEPEIGQVIWQEAINFNQIPVVDMEIGKKNQVSD